jgi:MoaA/NifB/PqqE/SkfB family radical SAM enzyme
MLARLRREFIAHWRGATPSPSAEAAAPSARQQVTEPSVEIAPGDEPETSATSGRAMPLNSEAERAQYAKNVFNVGARPNNFSINLGVAPCNHSCLFCPQSVQKPKRAGWLDLDLLRKVLSEMPENDMNLNISSYSETLAAPNLVPAVRLMKEIRPKLYIVMATNGSLFREQVIDDLIEAGLDHYSFSFDAPTRETYKRMMQVDHFDRAWQNLDRLVAMRNAKGSPMKVTSHIMGFEEFRADFTKFRRHWDPKLDSVVFRPVGNWGGGNWGLEKQFEKAGFTPIHKAPAMRHPCNSIFISFKLGWDGRYTPCVASVPDSSPEEENHDAPYLGDAREITFWQAWDNLAAMRQAHLHGDWDKFACCSKCNVWSLWSNMWKPVDGPNGEKFDVPGVDYKDKAALI